MTDNAHPPQPSPCRGICRIDHAHGLCVGCYRNIEEICAWVGLGEDERLEIMRTCETREARLTAPVAGKAIEGK